VSERKTDKVNDIRNRKEREREISLFIESSRIRLDRRKKERKTNKIGRESKSYQHVICNKVIGMNESIILY